LHDEALSNIEYALRIARTERSRSAEEGAHAFAAMCTLRQAIFDRACALKQCRPQPKIRSQPIVRPRRVRRSVTLLEDESLVKKWFERL